MHNLLRYIIVASTIVKMFSEEDDAVIKCAATFLRDMYDLVDVGDNSAYVEGLVDEFGETNTIRALTMISEMYSKIV